MEKFVETEQTKKDLKFFEETTEKFIDLIRANQDKGYCGVISMTSDSIDCDVSGIGASYSNFLFLMARLADKAASGFGKTSLEVLSDATVAVSTARDIDATDRFFEAEKAKKDNQDD